MKSERDLRVTDPDPENQLDSTETANDSSEDSTVANADDSGRGLSVMSQLLPGVARSTNELVVVQERRQHYAHITKGYSEAIRTVRELENRPSDAAKERRTGLIKRLEHSGIILAAHADGLEIVRKKLGLDEMRERIIEDLRNTVSVDKGLSRLRTALGSRIVDQMDDAALLALFPNLTIAEVALLPLLTEIPGYILAYGAEVDFLPHLREQYSERRKRIPQFLHATAKGVCIATDDHRVEDSEHTLYDFDPFQSLGLTGLRDGEELAYFSRSATRSIRLLFPLMVSNSQLFNAVWDEAQDAVQIAFGKIERFALEEQLGEVALDPMVTPIEMASKSLNELQRAAFQKRCRAIQENIANSAVYDASRKRLLNAIEKFKLAGLLAEIPKLFLGEEPTCCYVVAFGAALRFLHEDGSVLEHIPLAQMYCRNAVQQLHWMAEDGSSDNLLAQQIFAILRKEMSDATMKRFEANQVLSVSETLAMEQWISRGVAMDVTGNYEMTRKDEEVDIDWGSGLNPGEFRCTMSKKIGAEEAAMLTQVLDFLPRKMLARVQRIRKLWTEPRSLCDRMNGTVTLGEYEAKPRRISLMESRDSLFPDSTQEQKIMLGFTLLHEIGEALWTTLSATQIERWSAISWPRSPRQNIDQHFLTHYAYTENPKEDFCEHFAAYVIHGKEFHERTRASRALLRKYRFIFLLFKQIAEQEIEYPGVAQSIREVHGALEIVHKQRSLAEAIADEELEASEIEAERREALGQVREDIDEVLAELDRDPEDEDTETKTKTEEDWNGIQTFIKLGVGMYSKEDAEAFAGNEDAMALSALRAEVVEIVRELLPERSGRVLQTAAAVAAALLYGEDDELMETLQFVKASKRGKAFRRLMSLLEHP